MNHKAPHNRESETPRPGRAPYLIGLLLIAVALLATDAGRRFRIDASMDHFLPGQGERELYRVSRRVVESTLTQRMILTISWKKGGTNEKKRTETHAKVAKALAKRLEKTAGIKRVTSSPPEGLQEAFFETYFPRRFAFHSMEPEKQASALFSDSGLQARVRELKERLAGAEGVLLKNTAPRDPWLLFPKFLDELQNDAFALEVRDGQFFAPNGKDPLDHAVLFVELSESALDADLQGPLLRALDAHVGELKSIHPGDWFVETSGANRFAVRTQKSMKADMERVFSLSTFGLVLLFLGLFRTLRRLLFLLLPLVSGLIFATWLSLVLYGELHALTLAFGSALIGVAIDYPVHILSHHDLESTKQGPYVTVRHLIPTLLLASGTTVLGLLGLAWTAFPGIREIAVFTCSGVVAAVLTAVVTSGLLKDSGGAPALTRRVASVLETSLERLRSKRLLLGSILATSALLCVAGLSQAKFTPGLDSLAPLDESLMAEDNRVRSRVGADDGGKLIVSLAKNLEQALQVNEQVSLALSEAQTKGWIDGFTNLSTLLRSKALQERARSTFTREESLATRTRTALEKEGFVTEAFPNLEEELSARAPPLLLSDLQKTPLADLLNTLIFRSGDKFAVISPLRELHDESSLKQAISLIPGAHYFSQRAVLDQAYGDLRRRTSQLLLVGLLFVACAAFFRYRNFRKAAAAVLPAIFASGATLGVLALFGHELNLLHLLGLLLVCSMGVDYGVFLVDSPKRSVGSALLSISVGCTSTMLSFGALSMSQAPALVALGSSIAIGIGLALLLAPTALLFLRPQTEDRV